MHDIGFGAGEFTDIVDPGVAPRTRLLLRRQWPGEANHFLMQWKNTTIMRRAVVAR
jgi:hypothetical protein